MNWYPSKRSGLLWGLGLLVALTLAGYLLLRRMRGAPISLALYLGILLFVGTLALAVLIAYAWVGLAGLAYRVERNGIGVRWAAHRNLAPMADIVEVVPLSLEAAQVLGGVGWPGYRFGRARVRGIGRVRLYVTRMSGPLVLIRTRGEPLLISPDNVEGFLADYRARRALGPIAQWKLGERLPRLLRASIWRDRPAVAALLPALALNLALFGYLANRYAGLPPSLVLSFDPQGLADRIGSGSALLRLPAIGLGILFVNGLLAAWLHRRERILALLLAGNTPIVQVLLWWTVVRLLR